MPWYEPDKKLPGKDTEAALSVLISVVRQM
jgi:hypothetical protein